MAEQNLKSTTIRSLFWKLFEQGGSAVITLVVQVVMARILSPEEFGMLAIMVVFVNIGNVIVQSGLNTAIIQTPDASERDFNTVFWLSLGISLVLYAAMFLGAPMIADFYESPSVLWPLRVLMLIVIVNAYNAIQEAIIARELDFNKTFRATVIAGIVSGTLGIASALLGVGIWALVIQQLSFQIAKCVVLAFEVPWKPRAQFEPARARVLFGFGWKLLASGLLEQCYNGLSDLIIGKVFSSSDLGYVSQGKKWPQYLGVTLDGAIQPVILSAVAKVQADPAQVKRLARRALKTSTYLIVPSMTLFAVAARPIVSLLLGDKWLASVTFLQVYCFIYALLPIHTTNLQVLNGMGRSDIYLKLQVIKNLLGIAMLSFTTLVLRDLNAIVAGYAITGVLCTIVNAFPNRKIIGYDYLEQVRDILPAFLLSIVAAAIAWPISLLGVGRIATIVLQAIVLLGSYVIASALLHVEEFEYLKRTIIDVVRSRRGTAA